MTQPTFVQEWQRHQKEVRRRRAERHPILSMSLVCLNVLTLVGGQVLPLALPPGSESPWSPGGVILSQFGPHLLGDKLDGSTIWVFAYLANVGLILALLLGVAGLVGKVIAGLAGVVSVGLALLSSLLLLGLNIDPQGTVGVGAWLLPIGAIFTLVSCSNASLRSAWVRDAAW